MSKFEFIYSYSKIFNERFVCKTNKYFYFYSGFLLWKYIRSAIDLGEKLTDCMPLFLPHDDGVL